MTELDMLIEDIKEHEMSMYSSITPVEAERMKVRIRELWKEE